MLEIRKDFCAFRLILHQNYLNFKVRSSFYREIFRFEEATKPPQYSRITVVFHNVKAEKSR